jgi:citrate lyase subunit beta/citryl-CoA lyase
MDRHAGWMLPLFVPATKPELFRKAAASGADAIVVDLEDAVADSQKIAARSNVALASGLGIDVILRVNAIGTAWHDGDLLLGAGQPLLCAVMIPKVESAEQIEQVRSKLGSKPLIALIETVEGLRRVDEIARATDVVQLGLGTQDLSAELDCAPDSRLFEVARYNLLVASRSAGIAPPIDGVSLSLDDAAGLEADAKLLLDIGFGGKFCIHPNQIAPLRQGLMPDEATIERARRIVAGGQGAARIDGLMIDEPVRRRAGRQILRAERLTREFILSEGV